MKEDFEPNHDRRLLGGSPGHILPAGLFDAGRPTHSIEEPDNNYLEQIVLSVVRRLKDRPQFRDKILEELRGVEKGKGEME